MLSQGKQRGKKAMIGETLVKVMALSHRPSKILRFNQKIIEHSLPTLYHHTNRASV